MLMSKKSPAEQLWKLFSSLAEELKEERRYNPLDWKHLTIEEVHLVEGTFRAVLKNKSNDEELSVIEFKVNFERFIPPKLRK